MIIILVVAFHSCLILSELNRMRGDQEVYYKILHDMIEDIKEQMNAQEGKQEILEAIQEWKSHLIMGEYDDGNHPLVNEVIQDMNSLLEEMK